MLTAAGWHVVNADRANIQAARTQFRSRRNCQAIVDVMAPKPGETVSDPVCGAGGFLVAAHDYVVRHNPNLSRDPRKQLKEETF